MKKNRPNLELVDEGCKKEIKSGCPSSQAGRVTRKCAFAEKTRETTKVAEDTGATAADNAAAEATVGAAAAVAVTCAARTTSPVTTAPITNREAAGAWMYNKTVKRAQIC